MIDNFSLGLTHLLMLIAAWRLIFRDDLDKENPPLKGEGDRRNGGGGVSAPEDNLQTLTPLRRAARATSPFRGGSFDA